MTPRRLSPYSASLALAAGLLGIALAVPAPAEACSMDQPVRHFVQWTAGGALALVDPAGHVARVSGQSAGAVALADEYDLDLAAFSPDGRTMIALDEDFSDQDRGAGCLATYVHIWKVDLSTGARTRLRRLRSSAAYAVRFNSAGTLLLVVAANFVEVPHVHLFDVESGERLRVTPGANAHWLDDRRWYLEPEEGRARVIDATTGRLVANGPAAPESEATTLRFLAPGATRAEFWMVERRGSDHRLVRARVDGRRIRRQRLTWTFRGWPIAVSGDQRRLATIGQSGALVRVRDTATGRVVARVSGQTGYTTAALDETGTHLAIASHAPIPADEAASAITDLSAFQPATFEVLDLEAGTRRHVGPNPASVVRLATE